MDTRRGSRCFLAIAGAVFALALQACEADDRQVAVVDVGTSAPTSTPGVDTSAKGALHPEPASPAVTVSSTSAPSSTPPADAGTRGAPVPEPAAPAAPAVTGTSAPSMPAEADGAGAGAQGAPAGQTSSEPQAAPDDKGSIEVLALWNDPCPSDSVPPRPECAPQPLPGVTVVVRQGDHEVARGVTGEDGKVCFDLPPGDYVVAGQPKEGYRITPQPVPVSVSPRSRTNVKLGYSTGGQ